MFPGNVACGILAYFFNNASKFKDCGCCVPVFGFNPVFIGRGMFCGEADDLFFEYKDECKGVWLGILGLILVLTLGISFSPFEVDLDAPSEVTIGTGSGTNSGVESLYNNWATLIYAPWTLSFCTGDTTFFCPATNVINHLLSLLNTIPN